jgi:hypothetical protein
MAAVGFALLLFMLVNASSMFEFNMIVVIVVMLNILELIMELLPNYPTGGGAAQKRSPERSRRQRSAAELGGARRKDERGRERDWRGPRGPEVHLEGDEAVFGGLGGRTPVNYATTLSARCGGRPSDGATPGLPGKRESARRKRDVRRFFWQPSI